MWFPNPQQDCYSVGVTWQLIPFHSLYHGGGAINKAPRFSITKAKKFMLYRSLFDLVNSSYCLELHDKKLQSWYYSLSDEERKIIKEEGGFHQFLLKHPALDVAKHTGIVHVKPQIRRTAIEMSTNLNKSRMPTFYGMPQCKMCGTSCPSGSETCRACIGPPTVGEERVCLTGQRGEPAARQSHVREVRDMPSGSGVVVWGGNSHSAPGGQVTQDSFQSAFDDSRASLASPGPKASACSQAQRFSKEWREGRTSVQNITTFKDSTAQASFSLDVELERHCKIANVSSHPTYQVRQAQLKAAADKSYLDLAQETPPEYYSFNSTMFDQTSADLMENCIHFAEEASVDSLIATRGSTERTENSLMTSSTDLYPSEVSASCPRCPSEWTNLDTTTDESLRNQPRDEFHSVMEESEDTESWLNCSVTPDNPNASPTQSPCEDLPVKLRIEKGQQTPWKEEQSVAESFMPVSPEKSVVHLPVSAARATVNQMVDASGDFRASFTCTQECAAAPSTLDASTEMDFPMCFDQDTQTSQSSTSDKCVITEIYTADLDYLTQEFMRLKSVEEEFEHLKAGQLKPSMKCGCDCGEKLKQAELQLLTLQYSMCQDHCWRRYYTSAQGERQLHCPGRVPESLAETLQALEQDYNQLRRQVLSGARLDALSVDTLRLNTEARYTPAQIAVTKPAEAQPKPDGVKSSKVGFLKTQKSGSSRLGGSEEGGNVTSEAWYDAEEDLAGDGDRRKLSSSCEVCVTDLHQDVTEEDLLALFEKYQPKEMRFTVSNMSRSANVTVSSPENAEVAVRELSGTLIHGQPIQVRRVGRPHVAAGPEGDLTFKKPHAPSAPKPAPKPAPSGNAPKPGSVKTSTPYNMSPKPSRSRLEKLINVSNVPTATGTYVPQQPPANTNTLGSFDTLMGRLSERHPHVARQKIVEALLELRAQRGGSLSGLPLRTIVDMTSELLTIQASVSQ